MKNIYLKIIIYSICITSVSGLIYWKKSRNHDNTWAYRTQKRNYNYLKNTKKRY